MKIFPSFETERLLLRELTLEDAEDLYETFSDEAVMIYFGEYPFKDITQAEQFVKNYKDAFENDRAMRWGIELKSEKKIIGSCGIHNWSKIHKRLELGYEINPKYWCKGYASEGILRIIDYAFDELAINRIEGLVYPENTSSINALEKFGFKQEGLLKAYMIFREKPQDLYMYSKLNPTLEEL